MEQVVSQDVIDDLTTKFYKLYLKELETELKDINEFLETFGEIYMRRITKKDDIFRLANDIINILLNDKDSVTNEIRRITARSKADSEVLRWH